MQIDTKLVHKLIDSQFPQWSDLSINPVPRGGHDNRTFKLGSELLVRMPSAESYAPQVAKEQKWLPFLGERLFTAIPDVLGLGRPQHGYPWSWSVYRWIEGYDARAVTETESTELAQSIAQFIKELHNVSTSAAPPPGSHNYFRGGNLQIYDKDTRAYIGLLSKEICADAALSIWAKALKTRWISKPVWIHGDLEASNIIVSERKLVAVIDFGNCAVGDPACDLVMAWTFFNETTRREFRENLDIDSHTWERGRAWALWKALFRMSQSLELRDHNFYAAKRLVSNILTTST